MSSTKVCALLRPSQSSQDHLAHHRQTFRISELSTPTQPCSYTEYSKYSDYKQSPKSPQFRPRADPHTGWFGEQQSRRTAWQGWSAVEDHGERCDRVGPLPTDFQPVLAIHAVIASQELSRKTESHPGEGRGEGSLQTCGNSRQPFASARWIS